MNLNKKNSSLNQVIIVLSVLAAVFVSSCDGDSKSTSANSIFTENELIADTIFYPVTIKNLDTTDVWASTRLKKLNTKKLVDGIFTSVLEEKSTAYNYLTDRAMSVDEVKALEMNDNFSRDNVVELEFREIWWYSPDRSVFKKEVLSVLVAYAVYDEFGDFSMKKAAFYIKLN